MIAAATSPFALAALAAALAGCHGQNPYGVWGPSRIPPPSQAKALPYYPPASNLGQTDAVPRSALGSLASRAESSGSQTTARGEQERSDRNAVGFQGPSSGGVADSRLGAEDSAAIRIEPEDREPIRIVENPRPAVQTARASPTRSEGGGATGPQGQGFSGSPAPSSPGQAPPQRGPLPRQPEKPAEGANVPLKPASAGLATRRAIRLGGSMQAAVASPGLSEHVPEAASGTAGQVDPAVRPASAETFDRGGDAFRPPGGMPPAGWKSR